jgi:hypothetical protein
LGAQGEQTVQAIVEQCLEAAIAERASDIHIEPQGDKVLFRMRVDGMLRIWRDLPIDLHPQIVSRLKVIARLDISDKRRPQDGRFTLTHKTGSVRDFRISTAPMLEGEKVVIRVLHQDLSKLGIKNVGYSEPNLKVYQELLNKPHGLLLHCGPTGSGKTTALYAAINHLFIQQKPNLAEGLTEAFHQLRRHPVAGTRRVHHILSCQTGENFWAQEFNYAYLRNASLMPEPLTTTLIAESLGDVGAAAGPIQLGRALHYLRKVDPARAGATRMLIYGCADAGHVGACVIEGADEQGLR